MTDIIPNLAMFMAHRERCFKDLSLYLCTGIAVALTCQLAVFGVLKTIINSGTGTGQRPNSVVSNATYWYLQYYQILQYWHCPWAIDTLSTSMHDKFGSLTDKSLLAQVYFEC